jgi:hypothetical protein
LQQQHTGDRVDAGQSVGEGEARHHGSRHRHHEQPRAIARIHDHSQLAAEIENRDCANRGEHDRAGAEEQGIEVHRTPSCDHGLASADDRVDDAERHADLKGSGAQRRGGLVVGRGHGRSRDVGWHRLQPRHGDGDDNHGQHDSINREGLVGVGS